MKKYLLFIPLFFLGCLLEFTIDLIDGYYINRVGSREVILCDKNNRVVIGSEINLIGIKNSYIYGNVIAHERKKEEIPGYFILNTVTGHLVKGMDEVTWQMEWQKLFPDAPPDLKRPVRNLKF